MPWPHLVVALLSCVRLNAAFAAGEKEAGKKAAVPAALEKGLLNYSTLAEYTKQTGKTITEFQKAPVLPEMVKAAKLPAVAQRLPEEPMVAKTLEQIGRYGGTLRQAALAPTTPEGRCPFGLARGKIHLPDGFNEPDPEIGVLFNSGD